MTTTNQYDYLNRLRSKTSVPAIGSPLSFNYNYNAANQRTLDRLADNSVWRYQYDALGQVTAGQKFWSDGTPVAGQQFDYAFDTIGNRTQTQTGGDATGANLRVANYTNNSLNQITSRGVPGYVDIMGDALATNSVTVNGVTPYQKGEYFREQLAVPNTSSAVWTNITAASPGQASVTGNAYVAQTPENYSYDLDGNLLSDGRWNYVWDGENRLISMTSLSGAATGSKFQLNFVYDYRGRRIEKMVSTNNGSSYGVEYTNIFVYDAWNCLAIWNPSFGLMTSCMWGSDLSGSLQGAGGVGGLLATSTHDSGGTMTNCFVAYDGNGNVCGLIKASNGTNEATYEYGPFGELIRCSGPLAKANPFRFSTKYDDDETDLLYYGYRYYSASTGRWLSRDALAIMPDDTYAAYVLNPDLLELLYLTPGFSRGALDYVAVNNDAIYKYDLLGLQVSAPPPPSCTPPFSVTGTLTIRNEYSHKVLHQPGNTLTYTVCCPKCIKSLSDLTLTSAAKIQSPKDEPFPGGWTMSVVQISFDPGPCYLVTVEVPYRATQGPFFGPGNLNSTLSAIQLTGKCCDGGN